MSEQQIQQILKTLKEQNEKEELRAVEHQKTFLIIRNDIANLQEDMKPVLVIFNSVTGFNRVSILLLKGLVLLGAGIGVMYGFIKFLKN